MDVKDNEKGFPQVHQQKKKTQENMSPLLNGAGNLATKYIQKAVVLTAFFISAFTEKTYLQESQVLQTSGKA